MSIASDTAIVIDFLPFTDTCFNKGELSTSNSFLKFSLLIIDTRRGWKAFFAFRYPRFQDLRRVQNNGSSLDWDGFPTGGIKIIRSAGTNERTLLELGQRPILVSFFVCPTLEEK